MADSVTQEGETDQAPSQQSGFGLAGKYKGWAVRATRLWGINVGLFVMLVAELLFFKPQSDPQHFLLTVVTVGILGGTLVAAVLSGRIKDLTQELERSRVENDRIARSKAQIEERFLNNRLSSDRKGAT